MKFHKIVVFGDSFVWGDELLDPVLVDHPQAHPVLMENTTYRERSTFAGQLGQHYDVVVTNFGWPGGSLQSAIWTYLWWIENEHLPLDQCLVLIGLTSGNRTSFYNPNHVSYANDPPWNKFVHSSWIHSGSAAIAPDWMDMGRRYMALTDCQELVRLNFRQAVLFFQGQAGKHTGLLQFKTIQTDLTLQDPNLLWQDRALQTFFDHLPDAKSYICAHGHPNEKGHRLIADSLIPEIDRVIMST